jgi:hypothetical protein
MTGKGIVEYVQNNVGRHTKEMLLKDVIQRFKCNREYALKVYNRFARRESKSTSIVGLSETELRSRHDNLFKIREAVKKLEKGKYLTDQQMRDFSKIPTNYWRAYSENQEFDKYKIRLNKVTYWATPDSIKRLGDLSAF